MRKCYCGFVFLFLNIVNVYGIKLPEEYVFMKKLQQNFSPQRYLYNENAVEQIITDQHSDGGITEVDPNNIKYYELAKESLQKYVEDTGAKQHHVLEVTKATEQVVAGSMTRIDFEAGLTDDELDEQNLSISRSSEVNVYYNNIITCHSEIWDRPWINSRIIEVNCWKTKLEMNFGVIN